MADRVEPRKRPQVGRRPRLASCPPWRPSPPSPTASSGAAACERPGHREVRRRRHPEGRGVPPVGRLPARNELCAELIDLVDMGVQRGVR
ncbi:hypothetical protein LV779_12245 [Streptomyces thinghirensis]|nr:hypothetical protein [Streptomyces thinghirensis]